MYPTNPHLLGQGATLDYDYIYESEMSATLDFQGFGVKDGDTTRKATVLTSLYGEEYDEGNSIDGDEEKNWEGISNDGVNLYTVPGSPGQSPPPAYEESQRQLRHSEHVLYEHHHQNDGTDQNSELDAFLIQEIAKLGSLVNSGDLDVDPCPQEESFDTEGFMKPSAHFIRLLKNSHFVSPSDTEDSDDFDLFTFKYMETEPDESLPMGELNHEKDKDPAKKTNDSLIARFTTSDDELAMDFADHIDFFKHLDISQDTLDYIQVNGLHSKFLQDKQMFNWNLRSEAPQEKPHSPGGSILDINNDFSKRLWAQSGWCAPSDRTKDCSHYGITSSDEDDTPIYAPVSLKLRLVTCGSTAENTTSLHISKRGNDVEHDVPDVLDEVLEDDRMCDAPIKLNDFGYPFETGEEVELRRLKEKTINHNDFTALEEFTLCDLFLIEKGPAKIPLFEERMRTLLNPPPEPLQLRILTSSPLTSTNPAKKVVTLYSKDKISTQFDDDRVLIKTDGSDDEETLEDWIQSITRGLETGLNDQKTDHMTYIDGESLFLEFIASDSDGEGNYEDNSNYENYLPDTKTYESNTTLAALSGLDDTAENPQTTTHLNGNTREELNENVKGDSPSVGEIGSVESLSPPGTVTALLVSHSQIGSLIRFKSGSRFQERCRSISESTEPASHSTWTLNNRLSSLPLPHQPKRRKSIRRIFFPKSSVPIEEQSEMSNATSKANVLSIAHTQREIDTKGSLRLKTLWRSKTFSRKPSTSHYFNLESGVSLNTVAAEYLSKTDLSILDDGEIISNGTESVRRMLSSNSPRLQKQDADTALASSDSQDTLTTFFDEKFGTHHKSVSEHISTPAPFPAVVQDVHDSAGTRRRFLGLRRPKTVSARRNPTIRFATSPEYITDETLKNDNTTDKNPAMEEIVVEPGEHAPAGDAHKSILKRSHTLHSRGKSRSIFRSLFGYHS